MKWLAYLDYDRSYNRNTFIVLASDGMRLPIGSLRRETGRPMSLNLLLTPYSCRNITIPTCCLKLVMNDVAYLSSKFTELFQLFWATGQKESLWMRCNFNKRIGPEQIEYSKGKVRWSIIMSFVSFVIKLILFSASLFLHLHDAGFVRLGSEIGIRDFFTSSQTAYFFCITS